MIDFLIILAVIWLTFAVIQDLRKREIANWLNFSFIIFALIYRLFYSIFSQDFQPIMFGLIGLGVFFLIANLFYYLRFFAGGDAKLLMALGVIIPFSNDFYTNSLIFFVFFIALLVGGAAYSLIYSFYIGLNNFDKLSKDFKKQFTKGSKYFYFTLVISLFILVLGIFFREIIFSFIALFIFAFPLIYFYLKAVESSCMKVYLDVKDLTLGDWLAEKISVKGKTIAPYWEGLNEDQLALIQKHYKKKVLVKQGIPFSPSFLIAFLVLVYVKYLRYSNWGFW